MHVALLFPPAVDPRAPHLAIPSLAAALKQEGARVTAMDLNLQGLLWALQRERLEGALAAVHDRLARCVDDLDQTTALRSLLARAPMAIDGCAEALATLRSAEGFLDPDRYNEARALVRCGVALFAAQQPRVCYGISNAVYEAEGCNRSLLADLVCATDDAALNLFDAQWRDDVLPQLERDRPDVVGVSILNGQQILPGLTLARMLRSAGHTVVIGGTVYAKFVRELLARPEFFRHFCHGVVPYEGEPALRALVRQGGWRDAAAEIPNLISLDRHGRPVIGPAVAEDVDTLPTPDFSVLPLQDYLAPYPVLPILTGKGCYFNRCKFCDIPHINEVASKPYRVRRAETIAADLEHLHRAHDARHFVITDETLSPRLLLHLADAIDARPGLRGVALRFVGYARLEPGFTDAACRRIHAMGVRKLFFGLESASQAMLDHMDKGISTDVAVQVLRNCEDAGLAVHVFSMIGFPQEDEASARQTHAFFVDHAGLLGHPRHSFDIHRFGLDLRTDYFEQAGRHAITIDRPHLARRDFPLSVERWSNPQGLPPDRVETLLIEFEHHLHRLYRGTHLYPDQHWPGFEEYAVIYGDHYDSVEFAFRTALPGPGDGQSFVLRWAPRCRVGPPDAAGDRALWGPSGEARVGALAWQLLEPLPVAGDVAAFMDTLAARVELAAADRAAFEDEVRELVDELLAQRLLWYRPAELAPKRRARPSASHERFRWRDDTALQLEYRDDSPFGSALGDRLAANCRRLFEPVLAHARDAGTTAAIVDGERLIADALSPARLEAVAQVRISARGHAWQLRAQVLHPDPRLSFPGTLALQGGCRGATLRVPLSAPDMPALADLVAHLAEDGDPPSGARQRGWLDEFIHAGFVEPAYNGEPVGRAPPAFTFVGHNTVVMRSAQASIVVDPFLPSALDALAPRPLVRSALGPVDAILITHGHPDHFDPGSLLQFRRDSAVFVPQLGRESMLAADLAARCCELGFERVTALSWGEQARVGDLEISALPFFGEQPTAGAVLHPDVRNHGNTYVVRGPSLAAAFVADAGRDRDGDMAVVARQWVADAGPIDVLFAGYRGWKTYPVQLAFSSVPQYLLFVPRTEWPLRQQLMFDAGDAVSLAEAWGAGVLVPYGAGGARWYWQRGLGPRLDGGAPEDVDFDPFPVRVVAAARERAWVRDRWLSSTVRVELLEPGDGLHWEKCTLQRWPRA